MDDEEFLDFLLDDDYYESSAEFRDWWGFVISGENDDWFNEDEGDEYSFY